VTLASLAGTSIGANSYIEVRLNMAENAAKRLDVVAVQFEPGIVATPFEHRSVALEYALCQRYFERLWTGAAYTMIASGTCTTTAKAEMPLRYARKRAVPTFSPGGDWRIRSGTAYPAITFLGLSYIGLQASRMEASVASGLTLGHGAVLQAAADSTAFLDLDAEL